MSADKDDAVNEAALGELDAPEPERDEVELDRGEPPLPGEGDLADAWWAL